MASNSSISNDRPRLKIITKRVVIVDIARRRTTRRYADERTTLAAA